MKCSSIYGSQVEDRNGVTFEVNWVHNCWFPKMRPLERRNDKRGSRSVRGGHRLSVDIGGRIGRTGGVSVDLYIPTTYLANS